MGAGVGSLNLDLIRLSTLKFEASSYNMAAALIQRRRSAPCPSPLSYPSHCTIENAPVQYGYGGGGVGQSQSQLDLLISACCCCDNCWSLQKNSSALIELAALSHAHALRHNHTPVVVVAPLPLRTLLCDRSKQAHTHYLLVYYIGAYNMATTLLERCSMPDALRRTYTQLLPSTRSLMYKRKRSHTNKSKRWSSKD